MLKDEILKLLEKKDMTVYEMAELLPKFSQNSVRVTARLLRKEGCIFVSGRQGSINTYSLSSSNIYTSLETLQKRVLDLLKERDMTANDMHKRMPDVALISIQNTVKRLRRDELIFVVGEHRTARSAWKLYSLEEKPFKKDFPIERVLRALKEGNHTAKEIAEITLLPIRKVSLKIAKLKGRGQVFVERTVKEDGRDVFVYTAKQEVQKETEGRVVSGFGDVVRRENITKKEDSFAESAQMFDQILMTFVKPRR